jgi:hypothetical protein
MILSSLPYFTLEKQICAPNFDIMRALVRIWYFLTRHYSLTTTRTVLILCSKNADVYSVYSVLSIFMENGCLLQFFEHIIADYFNNFQEEPETGYFRGICLTFLFHLIVK